MRELPHFRLVLPGNICMVYEVNAAIDEQWTKFVKSIVEPIVSEKEDLQNIREFLCMWATFCFTNFERGNEYLTKSTFPNFTINVSLIT